MKIIDIGSKQQNIINDRRGRLRFPMNRELRYKVLEEGTVVASGDGESCNISSQGVAFICAGELKSGSFIELSISWPVLLEDRCPMRMIVFGRVVRSCGRQSACTIDKYEFRTQARTYQMPARSDSMLQRWADAFMKESTKVAMAGAAGA
jgi:hypothetical protein